MSGGWTGFQGMNPTATAVFDEALKGLLGVKYTPLAYATQVVNGTNYCFLANGTVVAPDGPTASYHIYVYQPIKGSPYLTEIRKIGH